MNNFPFIVTYLCFLRLAACAPYDSSSNQHSQSSETLIFNNVENLSFGTCGKAPPNEPFPWDVQLKLRGQVCAGVLISSLEIITSASCLPKIYNISEIQVHLRNSSEEPTLINRANIDNATVILSLKKTIPNAVPICLWNFGDRVWPAENFSLYDAGLKDTKIYSAILEASEICNNLKINDMRIANHFFCTKSDIDDSNDLQQFNANDHPFLINFFDGRWYLRGLKLQGISFITLNIAFNDLSLHLRSIAEKSYKIYALPKIPKSNKAHDFKSGEENLSYPSCGVSADEQDDDEHSGNQIFGGDVAEGAHPWFAQILTFTYDNQTKMCGGTLIRHNVVVTAAHCLLHDNEVIGADHIKVFFGNAEVDNTTQFMKPKRVIVHKNYTKSRHDIALLIFDKNSTFTSKVSALCLWNKPSNLNYIVDSRATVFGFGVHQIASSGVPETSGKLQRVHLPIVSYEKCFQTGSDATFWNKLLPGENFCAGYKNEGRSTCQGDSGGGLAIKDNGRWFLRGIVSFGPVLKGTSICDPNNYSVFLDVTHYLEWIEKSIGALVQKKDSEPKNETKPKKALEPNEATYVKNSTSQMINYLMTIAINFVKIHSEYVLIILAVVFSIVCALFLVCRRRSESFKVYVQIFSDQETTPKLEQIAIPPQKLPIGYGYSQLPRPQSEIVYM